MDTIKPEDIIEAYKKLEASKKDLTHKAVLYKWQYEVLGGREGCDKMFGEGNWVIPIGLEELLNED